jgi:probable O-glycosylation ligase (exosortase A-associated)
MPRVVRKGQGMRDFVMLTFFLVSLPLALRSAYAGYLLWGWAGLIAVDSYLYGFMQRVPYAQLYALATMTAVALRRDPQALQLSVNRTLVWMGVFVAHGFVCAVLAYPGLDRNWELFGNLAKTVLFCAFMPFLAVSRLRIHALVIMLALSVSFHGMVDGLKFISSGGAHKAAEIPKFGDNNQYAMMLVMVMPLLIYLFRYSEKIFMRWGFGVVSLLTVFAVISTNSRGAFIGLFLLAILIMVMSKHRVRSLLAIFISFFLVFSLAPDSWTSRMQTIEQANEDASFMGRVSAWKVSSAIAIAHPVFGGGFRAVQSKPVWEEFAQSPGLLWFVDTPILTRSGVAAHSIWFEVMGDLGFVGLFLFVALLINAFKTRREIRRLAREQGPEARWAGDLSHMLAASLIIYVVSGSALSAAYFEYPYICMMALEVVKLEMHRRREADLATREGIARV